MTESRFFGEAAFVIGLESSPTAADSRVVVERLRRAVRPSDSVTVLDPLTVAVVCTTLTNVREVDAVATRLARVARAPIGVAGEIRSFGVCVGSAVAVTGEERAASIDRAHDAMRDMRHARSGLLAPVVPGPRQRSAAALPS